MQASEITPYYSFQSAPIPGENKKLMPADALVQIFSELDATSLNTAMHTCRNWRRVAYNNSRLNHVWSAAITQAYPERGHFLTCLEQRRGTPNPWYQMWQAQNQDAEQFRKGKSARAFENLLANSLDGDAALLQAFRCSTHSIYMRCTPTGALGILSHSPIMICNIKNQSKIPLPTDEVFTPWGGVYLGLGWDARPCYANYVINQGLDLAREYVSLSSIYFTTSNGQRTLNIRSLDQQDPIHTHSLDENDTSKIVYVDSDQTGELFVITTQNQDESYNHVLVHKKAEGQYPNYNNLIVLAFDPIQSIAVYESLEEPNQEELDEEQPRQPIQLAKRIVSQDGTSELSFHAFTIPVAERYCAQIKGNYLAIMCAANPNTNFLWLMRIDQLVPENINHLLPDCSIDKFTLFEDYLVIFYKSMGKPGMAIFDLTTKQYTTIDEPIKLILARSGQVLLCTRDNKRLAFDLSTMKIVDSMDKVD